MFWSRADSQGYGRGDNGSRTEFFVRVLRGESRVCCAALEENVQPLVVVEIINQVCLSFKHS